MRRRRKRARIRTLDKQTKGGSLGGKCRSEGTLRSAAVIEETETETETEKEAEKERKAETKTRAELNVIPALKPRGLPL